MTHLEEIKARHSNRIAIMSAMTGKTNPNDILVTIDEFEWLVTQVEKLQSAELALVYYARLRPGTIYTVENPQDETEIAKQHFKKYPLEDPS